MEEGLSERLRERLGERFGEMLCTRLCEMLDPDMLQVYFRQASSRIQESLNLSQLPSPEEGLVFLNGRTVCFHYCNTKHTLLIYLSFYGISLLICG